MKCPHKNPKINFIKYDMNQKKILKMAKCENRPQMHEYMHEMMKIKSKGRAKGSYRLEEREILQKVRRKTTKISMWSLASLEREKKKFEKFEIEL